MLVYNIKNSKISNNIYIPKYYDPELHNELLSLSNTHNLYKLCDLINSGVITAKTGHEIGKMAYGTGNIPFVRTSDITNWEIKTIPKQGVSKEIYENYAIKEDVQDGDILLVRDGTYLIGTNCIVTKMDMPMIFQSHILKFRVEDKEKINPYLFFLVLNSPLVQRQIKNMQFTADIIDTLGNRYNELILPIPKSLIKKNSLISKTENTIETRIKNKAAIKQMPFLIESVLEEGTLKIFDVFFAKSTNQILAELIQDTTTLEFGEFSAYTIKSNAIFRDIFLPKYYDPTIRVALDKLKKHCKLYSVKELIENKVLELSTGDEIGKMAYGTGTIPFVRTSDFSNWEIKADAKQGVSEEIYQLYAEKEDVQAGDILLVRDGTYLVGTSCLITEYDTKMLYCGGLYKIRIKDKSVIDEFLLLGLLNSYIVKRQIRTKQFTRDVIDTLGRRFEEVILPIPNDKNIKNGLSKYIKTVIYSRIKARNLITNLSTNLCKKE